MKRRSKRTRYFPRDNSHPRRETPIPFKTAGSVLLPRASQLNPFAWPPSIVAAFLYAHASGRKPFQYTDETVIKNIEEILGVAVSEYAESHKIKVRNRRQIYVVTFDDEYYEFSIRKNGSKIIQARQTVRSLLPADVQDKFPAPRPIIKIN